MAIIEPFGLSEEERQIFHRLLDELTATIEQKVEQPSKPALYLASPSTPEITRITSEEDRRRGSSREQKAGQPARPVLRLLPSSHSRLTPTAGPEGNVMTCEQETLRAVTRALLSVAEDAVTALSQLMSDVPSSELYDFPVWLASAQAIIEQAEALVPRLRLVK